MAMPSQQSPKVADTNINHATQSSNNNNKDDHNVDSECDEKVREQDD